MTVINNNIPITTTPPADSPQPATNLTPEAIVDQLRAIRSQMGDVTPITPKQRQALRYIAATPREIVETTVNMLDFSPPVQQALGKPSADVKDMQQTASRWSAVEDELNSLLEAVSGANYIRRHQLALIAAQAYSIGTQLVRDPANAELMPHVREIKRLRAIATARKRASTPEQPSPSPSPTPKQ
ncbi:MAG TPA: hypothetical protein VGJ82_14220 [Thermoanaerobaculia bacterium]|jgi:hypothetical protein